MKSGEGKAAPVPERAKEEAGVSEEPVSARTRGEPEHELPDSYGMDRVVLMVRDPYWIHAYWELTEKTLSTAVRSLGQAASGARTILRVYGDNEKKPGPEQALFDLVLTLEARSWYINVRDPGRAYRVDIGLLTLSGKFVPLVSSNSVSTPPDRMSDVLGEEWRSLPTEYEEMYALSGGLVQGPSSFELHVRLARRLELGLASGLFSPGWKGDSRLESTG